jgi:hypothetical protein
MDTCICLRMQVYVSITASYTIHPQETERACEERERAPATAVSERVGERVTRARGREGESAREREREEKGKGEGEEGRGRDTARQRGLFSMSRHFVGLLGAEASSCVEDTQT